MPAVTPDFALLQGMCLGTLAVKQVRERIHFQPCKTPLYVSTLFALNEWLPLDARLIHIF
jgi:hypothetical protein